MGRACPLIIILYLSRPDKPTHMDNTLLHSKLSNLPEHLKAEVADFIDYLATKYQADQPTSNHPKPQFGSGKGMFVMHDDFDEPLEDFAEYMD